MSLETWFGQPDKKKQLVLCPSLVNPACYLALCNIVIDSWFM